ncbi:hypothetical protein DERF_010432 [Dermatophagoides farinae]|uniref:Uncharacterized protein n=1 Tax=Dermatophagoides farinae TaxID=6954 RepID=A0A922L3J0_DERFA|nr:hypothetical protein DERF_010432 [Dermatophagoides farinae]
MENNPSDNEKLIDVSTFIGSNDSAVDQFELNCNFSIVKIADDEMKKNSQTNDGSNSDSVNIFQASSSSSTVSTMENSPSDNEKLIDVSTFIGSNDSAVDQFELNCNFSIVNVDNNKGEKKIDEVKESYKFSKLDNPIDLDDYIIEPDNRIDHFVDLDYKADLFLDELVNNKSFIDGKIADDEMKKNSQTNDGSNSDSVNIFQASSSSSTVSTMEHSPSDNEKLIDVPTFIGSNDSDVDQFELNCNFSIINVDSNKGEMIPEKKIDE